jgi:hypothetical protein
LREKDESFHSQDADQGFSSPGLLAHPVLRLVDRRGILPLSFFEEKIKYPPLSGYLSRKIAMVLSLLYLVPVSLLRSHFCGTD